MADFAEAVGDIQASELLTRALQGRGAFRRFRDTLDEFDELRQCWLDDARAAGDAERSNGSSTKRVVSGDDTKLERDARTTTTNAALPDAAARHDLDVNEADLVDRWSELRDLVDAGDPITVTRNGQVWASITPVTRPGP